MSKLPISVISPVMNCALAMPAHSAYLRNLSMFVQEILVVDSCSHDGTMEYLRDSLGDTDVRFLDHPPGLYPSWNFAISHATLPYLTVATVGDVLPTESLTRLYETIIRLSGDVVISAPTMMKPNGDRAPKRWPVHDLLHRLGAAEPFVVDPCMWLVLAYGQHPASLIASSAGNLYRTSLLKNHPFPEDLGHWGDCGWALMMSHVAKWIIDPGVSSTFLVHPPSASRKSGVRQTTRDNCAALLKRHLELHREHLVESGVPGEILVMLGEVLPQYFEKQKLTARRQSLATEVLPWFLSPAAIRTRRRRSRLEKGMRHRREATMEFVAKRWSGGTSLA